MSFDSYVRPRTLLAGGTALVRSSARAVVDALSFLAVSAAGPLADAFRLMPPTGLPGRFAGTAETQVA
jgi:hypothetical protein